MVKSSRDKGSQKFFYFLKRKFQIQIFNQNFQK